MRQFVKLTFSPSLVYIFNFCLFSAVIDLWRLLSRRLKTAKKIFFHLLRFSIPAAWVLLFQMNFSQKRLDQFCSSRSQSKLINRIVRNVKVVLGCRQKFRETLVFLALLSFASRFVFCCESFFISFNVDCMLLKVLKFLPSRSNF